MATAAPDLVVVEKVATIERAVARARELFERDPATFASDITRHDAAIMNIQRAAVAALDCGQYLIRRERLGIPGSSRDVFALLAASSWISISAASSLQRIVDFRDVAIHDDQALHPSTTVAVIRDQLEDFLVFARQLLLRG